jgi:predicted aspartyl protease
MDSPPFLVSTLINGNCFAKTLVDTGCLSYGLIDSRFAAKHQLERISLKKRRRLVGFESQSEGYVTEVAAISIDIDGHLESKAYFYIAPRLASYDLILGLPWITKQDVRLNAPRSEIKIMSTGTTIQNYVAKASYDFDCVAVSAVAFKRLSSRKAYGKTETFAASLADITKALRTKTRTDPRTKLPRQYYEFLDVFSREQSDKLPPLRGKGVDHGIELEKQDGKDPQVPWGPLYNMSRDELLVLRKTLTEYLDKGFIRVSNSPAAAPVLFVRKPGGGLRFCVDYRGLNRITRKDRYPLPLIYETLQNVGRAKWFSKLDVIAAFHKIRIAKGDEWKTAFRTRYGLYEWLVTPFGLANAPSTFQRYINWALRDYLDDFCSAYVDDILVYTDGTLNEHREHVRKVIVRMREAGLQLDIDKCEFEVKTTKYLGFIIEAEKGISMDPAKVSAILEWEPPTTATSVRSFLGFANFYRTFIKNYSDLARPLTQLTHKDKLFVWTTECNDAFIRLKKMFTEAPILVRFDPDRETIVETDSSGWCIGGTLMQLQESQMYHPCAFFSKKNSPAECNYEIYDKEMLAIVRCLEQWDSDLRSVKGFEIRTDHKNLEYFMTVQKLTERQMRWSLILSRYNFTIQYIPGKTNERADALSRREQDMPKGASDGRVEYRTIQLLKPQTLRNLPLDSIRASPVRAPLKEDTFEQTPADDTPIVRSELEQLWYDARLQDESYGCMVECIRKEKRVFPVELKLKVSMSECSLSPAGHLMFRGRLWVPEMETLRTKIIQDTHDSKACGHPGRDNTGAIIARQFFWPNMYLDVKRFVRNCDTCGAVNSWKDRRQGFLKPLPIPDRIWSEISIDFVVELSPSRGRTNIVVVTDRLGKGVRFKGLKDIKIETVAKWFVRDYYPQHYLPRAIVSDRGAQFVSMFWTRVCQLLGIVRRLSTAYHPETDGATERMNSTMKAYLRTFCNHAQDDWYDTLPLAQLAIMGRNAASTGVSPFFLEHGYEIEPLDLQLEPPAPSTHTSPIERANELVWKLQQGREWAQTAMAEAQQAQENSTNRKRSQAPKFQVGDKVWLSLKNIRTDRPSKTLDVRNAKYTVIEVVGSHNYRLDTPPGISNVFHSQLLRLASNDPLPSQERTDNQPAPRIVQGDIEYEVEKILDEKLVRKKRKLLVKWAGYARPTWEPEDALEDTAALVAWEATKRRTVDGGPRTRRKRRRTK